MVGNQAVLVCGSPLPIPNSLLLLLASLLLSVPRPQISALRPNLLDTPTHLGLDFYIQRNLGV